MSGPLASAGTDLAHRARNDLYRIQGGTKSDDTTDGSQSEGRLNAMIAATGPRTQSEPPSVGHKVEAIADT